MSNICLLKIKFIAVLPWLLIVTMHRANDDCVQTQGGGNCTYVHWSVVVALSVSLRLAHNYLDGRWPLYVLSHAGNRLKISVFGWSMGSCWMSSHIGGFIRRRFRENFKSLLMPFPTEYCYSLKHFIRFWTFEFSTYSYNNSKQWSSSFIRIPKYLTSFLWDTFHRPKLS